jgi:hypothetical protein
MDHPLEHLTSSVGGKGNANGRGFCRFRCRHHHKKNKRSDFNFPRDELVDILNKFLPNDMANIIASYHPHPIVERIGKDNLLSQYNRLSVVPTYGRRNTADPSIGKGSFIRHPFNRTEDENTIYNLCRSRSQRDMNYILSAECNLHRVFHPLNITHSKIYILEYANSVHIKLYKSWTKGKMLYEFYKKIKGNL